MTTILPTIYSATAATAKRGDRGKEKSVTFPIARFIDKITLILSSTRVNNRDVVSISNRR